MTTRRGFLPRGDAGSATAEMALVLPVLAVVVGVLLWAVTVLTAQLRCVDAARAAARVLARGDSVTAATAEARAVAPRRARIVVSRSGELVRVEVSASISPAGGLGDLAPAITVSSSAVAAVEGASWPG